MSCEKRTELGTCISAVNYLNALLYSVHGNSCCEYFNVVSLESRDPLMVEKSKIEKRFDLFLGLFLKSHKISLIARSKVFPSIYTEYLSLERVALIFHPGTFLLDRIEPAAPIFSERPDE